MEQKRLDRPDREKITELGYELVSKHLSGFIDEFKVDVRKPLSWQELSKNKKAYWRDQILALIPDIEEGAYETNIRINKILSKVHQQHEIEIEEAKRKERDRVLSILQKEYPAIDTWQCWQALKGEK